MKEISHFLDAGKIDPADSGRPQMLNNPGDWPYSSVVALNLRHYSSSLKFQISLARIRITIKRKTNCARCTASPGDSTGPNSEQIPALQTGIGPVAVKRRL